MKDNPDPSLVECEIFIAADPEAIFRFLVKPELMEQWIGMSRVGEPGPRRPYSIAMDSGHVARGVYITVSPPRRIAFTWGWDGQDAIPPGTSLVEIELVPQDGGTLVRLRHSGLPENAPPLFSPASHCERWLQYLARLKAAVEFDC
jgi:uncharacterized protein YndB with AHSA1/START domain